jgi:hypothetical protein
MINLTDASGRLAGRSLEEWNAAYVKVENYFHALRVRNKALLGQLVLRVLERAMRRAPAEPDRPTTELAAEEMDRIVTEWFAEVLQSPPAKTDYFYPDAPMKRRQACASATALAQGGSAGSLTLSPCSSCVHSSLPPMAEQRDIGDFAPVNLRRAGREAFDHRAARFRPDHDEGVSVSPFVVKRTSSAV